MAKYYEGMICSTNFDVNPIVCVVCGQKVMGGKTREDKKNVCFTCYDKDENREEIKY